MLIQALFVLVPLLGLLAVAWFILAVGDTDADDRYLDALHAEEQRSRELQDKMLEYDQEQRSHFYKVIHFKGGPHDGKEATLPADGRTTITTVWWPDARDYPAMRALDETEIKCELHYYDARTGKYLGTQKPAP